MIEYPVVIQFTVKITFFFKITVPVKITLTRKDIQAIQTLAGGNVPEEVIIAVIMAFAQKYIK